MSYRTTAVLLALLAIVGAYMYFFSPREKEPEVIDNSDLYVVNVEMGSVRSLAVKQENMSVLIKRNSQGTWDLAEPEQSEGDQPRIVNVMEFVTKLLANRVVSTEAGDVANFGLVEPHMRVTLGVGSNDSIELLVGNKNPAGTGGYVKRADSDKVYLVGSYDLGLLESLLFQLPIAQPAPAQEAG